MEKECWVNVYQYGSIQVIGIPHSSKLEAFLNAELIVYKRIGLLHVKLKETKPKYEYYHNEDLFKSC